MDERLQILELIEAGEISVEEGARRLEASAEVAGAPDLSVAQVAPGARPAWVRWVWQAVFWMGSTLVAVGGLLVSAVYTGEVAVGWRVWSWLLFALGVLVVMLGWWLQRAHWLSVRVREPDGPRISFALPLPLGLVAWGLRVAAPFVPQLRGTGVDEVILAMQEEMRDGHSLRVEVDEGVDGEQVQVYLG
jgi:hypothetical protein